MTATLIDGQYPARIICWEARSNGRMYALVELVATGERQWFPKARVG